MGALDEITQMRSQGMPDSEIVATLQEKGVTPKEINDALNQSKIKNAVSNEAPENQQEGDVYIPQPQDTAPQEYNQQPQQEADQPDEYYPQDSYEGYSTGMDTDTVMEIAEQVFFEKIKTIQKQVELMNEFRNLAQSKIENIDERLKRIETSISNLQSAILEKIGEYGTNLESIKNEMGMMQDSFGKVMGNSSSQNPQTRMPVQKPTLENNITRTPSRKSIRKT